MLVSRKVRSISSHVPTLWLIAIALSATFLTTTGCGGGSAPPNPNLHYAPTGAYTYQVTATTTSGLQITQTTTLSLTIQ